MTHTVRDSSAAPFTQAQTEFLAVREAELEGIRERRNSQHFKRFRNSALAGFLVLAGGIGGSIYASSKDSDEGRSAIVQSGRIVAVDGCNRDFTTIQRLRNVLLASQAFQRRAFEAGRITADQYAEAAGFYQEQLAGLPLPDCRDARTIITDDPNKPKAVPDPKYPTDNLDSPTPLHGNP